MDGKVCVVTGAASGIGQQLAIALAKQGATVVAAARDEERAAGAVREIAAASGGRVEALACDVASIASMKRAAAELVAQHPELHLLVNNAAVFNKERRTSRDGLELGYAVNTLAPFVLSNLLLGALRAGAPSRIVNMTMAPTEALDFADLQAEKRYSGLQVLKTTKAGHQYLTLALARRLEGSGVRVVTVDPGLTRSKLPAEAPLYLRLAFRLLGKTPEAGARVPLSVCVEDRWRSGAFVSHEGVEVPMPAFVDAVASERLWAANAALAGL